MNGTLSKSSLLNTSQARKPRKKIVDPRVIQSAMDHRISQNSSPLARPFAQEIPTLPVASGRSTEFNPLLRFPSRPTSLATKTDSRSGLHQDPSFEIADVGGRQSYLSQASSRYVLSENRDTVKELDAKVAATLAEFGNVFSEETIATFPEMTRTLIMRNSSAQQKSTSPVLKKETLAKSKTTDSSTLSVKMTDSDRAKIRQMIRQRIQEKKARRETESV